MAETSDASGTPLHMVSSSEMDFRTLIEHEELPPIAFKDRKGLDRWISSNDLCVEAIGKRNYESHVVIVHGKICPWGGDGGLFYRQIWASVKYKRYRYAIKFQIKTTEGALKTVDLYDGDHAVGQTRLAKCWPDSWVNIVLVESRINRAVGAMMEKRPLKIESGQESIKINAECVLKTFLRREGALQQVELRQYLKEAREQFLSFPRVSGGMSRKATENDFWEWEMATNATGFFDHVTRELGLDPIDREAPTLLVLRSN